MDKLPTRKQRSCLRCGKMFRTKGPQHRICYLCADYMRVHEEHFRYMDKPVYKDIQRGDDDA